MKSAASSTGGRGRPCRAPPASKGKEYCQRAAAAAVRLTAALPRQGASWRPPGSLSCVGSRVLHRIGPVREVRLGEFVQVEFEAAVGVVRLRRPKMNALNAQVQTEIAGAASRLATDHQVRAVILYGGEEVFAAGADIKEMADAGYAEMAVSTQRLQNAFTAIAELPQP